MTDYDYASAWDDQAETLVDAMRATGADQPDMTRDCLSQVMFGLAPRVDPRSLFEIGCGIGRLTLPVARHYPQCAVIGVDASPRMLRHAKKRQAEKGVVNVRWMQAARPGTQGFGVEAFDGAWTVLTLQHLEPELARDYVVAIGRALKIGGRFVFQYIEGTQRAPLSNHFSRQDVAAWCAEGNLGIEKHTTGIGHDLWSWVTAVRR